MTVRNAVASWSPRSSGAWIDVAFVRIRKLASAIDNDPFRVEEWYRSERIR
jgi:hypothetical protein